MQIIPLSGIDKDAVVAPRYVFGIYIISGTHALPPALEVWKEIETSEQTSERWNHYFELLEIPRTVNNELRMKFKLATHTSIYSLDVLAPLLHNDPGPMWYWSPVRSTKVEANNGWSINGSNEAYKISEWTANMDYFAWDRASWSGARYTQTKDYRALLIAVTFKYGETFFQYLIGSDGLFHSWDGNIELGNPASFTATYGYKPIGLHIDGYTDLYPISILTSDQFETAEVSREYTVKDTLSKLFTGSDTDPLPLICAVDTTEERPAANWLPESIKSGGWKVNYMNGAKSYLQFSRTPLVGETLYFNLGCKVPYDIMDDTEDDSLDLSFKLRLRTFYSGSAPPIIRWLVNRTNVDDVTSISKSEDSTLNKLAVSEYNEIICHVIYTEKDPTHYFNGYLNLLTNGTVDANLIANILANPTNVKLILLPRINGNTQVNNIWGACLDMSGGDSAGSPYYVFSNGIWLESIADNGATFYYPSSTGTNVRNKTCWATNVDNAYFLSGYKFLRVGINLSTGSKEETMNRLLMANMYLCTKMAYGYFYRGAGDWSNDYALSNWKWWINEYLAQFYSSFGITDPTSRGNKNYGTSDFPFMVKLVYNPSTPVIHLPTEAEGYKSLKFYET